VTKKVQTAKATLKAHALSLPEAWEDHPWGESVIKVRKKIFIFLGGSDDPAHLRFTVKLPGSCTEALRREDAEPMGYGLGRSGWVTFTIPDKALPKQDVLIDWLEESYQAVAPKKLGRLLDVDED
jgi:predicted DNA-binding protein (MmcQ/YjbR family)